MVDEFMSIYGDIDLLRETLIMMLDLNGKSRLDPKTLLEKFIELRDYYYGEESEQ